MDKKDRAILSELRNNSRQSWREIGDKVFLSSQAVGQRVQDLLNNHIIEKFTIKEQKQNLQFITIYMNTNQFTSFENLVKSFNEVIEFYKITGDGCYMIISHFDSDALNLFLTKITDFGRYKVSHRLKQIL
ncbi:MULTISPECIES: Lrp/AsnC family transcriptional regulator [Gilliamella]|uniref:AsnC family transcriptional regulator n=1 Tax=Gilliamella apicola TaxID=1196095 RepID=A0A556SZH6_9GAMM|nr:MULTISPECIES: AsnC family transcriptional regulator [Gilliamella]MBI0031926.1 AsnC family transcriptional regulator [Gilliamella sp. B14384G15]MBI0059263.1 AsnC family transcriptional regulator [Gilliamella sp. B14384G12]MBI0094356.1 AsnC family transcriptional regulator [Gilliamella sp. W8136]TSK06475.1 AsnC family transcriptional regulator [Gilliamella apicola]